MKQKYSGNRWPNKEQTLLLQACLLSGRPALEAWQSWKEQVDFNKVDFASFKLLPLVSRNESLSSLQDPIFEKCKGIYRRVWVENHLTWKKMFSTLSHLLEAGVDKIVLLKGMAMILHYYRDFGVRVIGDVDILLARSQLPIADAALAACGWQPKFSYVNIKDQSHLKRWHALNFVHAEGMNLDLHWSFIEENSPMLDEAVLRDAKVLSEKNICLYIPNSADLLLQTCTHGMKHSEVPLIRWIADAVTILKHSEKEVDWERLVELASQAHVCLPLSTALEYLAEQFNAPVPREAIQKLKSTPSMRLEYLEHRFHVRGGRDIAHWARYCLNQGHLTVRSQILHIPKYLQFRARLKAFWHMPFYAIYWILKRTWWVLKFCGERLFCVKREQKID